MSTISSMQTSPKTFRPSFFLLITVAMSLFIFIGFGFTYLQPLASGMLDPTPPVVHIHGFLYFCWMLLLMLQALLINVKSVAMHRSLGTFGIALGTALIIFGSLITMLSVANNIADPGPDFYVLSYLSVTAIVSFAILFCLAIRSVRQLEKHKRYILFATINLLPPGINRLYMVMNQLTNVPVFSAYLTLDAFALAILVYDWRTLGRISKASIFGAALVLLPQLLNPVIVNSSTFGNFCALLADMTRYR